VLENKSYERLITLYCVEGWDATVLWKGVRVMDLLNEAEILNKNSNVIFHCVDGYTTSMPLETIETRDMLLAYSSNGVTLPESLGFPFIVVAEDKAGYKWARWVNEIEISDDLTYKGYWESRGYSNEADIRR
jgi:DMSO/TMAO reductase YedYZ molybdopterin-dependent catalytic subunit